jgi:hypothetical protein
MIGKRVFLNPAHWFKWRGFENVQVNYGQM